MRRSPVHGTDRFGGWPVRFQEDHWRAYRAVEAAQVATRHAYKCLITLADGPYPDEQANP